MDSRDARIFKKNHQCRFILVQFVVRNSCVWDIALNSQLSVQLRLRKAERVTNLSQFDCQPSWSWTCSTHQNVPPDGIKLSTCDLLVSVAADSGWLRLRVAVSMNRSCSTALLISQLPQRASYAWWFRILKDSIGLGYQSRSCRSYL